MAFLCPKAALLKLLVSTKNHNLWEGAKFTDFPSLCAFSESSLTNLIRWENKTNPICILQKSHLARDRDSWCWPIGAVTCDHVSLHFRGRKVGLIQLLDYLSVASPESGLFSDWSRNKRYLELSHNWFPVWQCDFRSKKSRELINSIMTSDDASKESEFLSALNASPENFVHKALKDEQIECNQRIVCHGRDVSAVLPTGLGKSAIYQFRMGRAANATSKTTAELLVFCWLTKWNGTFTKFYFWNLLIMNETGRRVLENKPYICRLYCTVQHCR